MLREDDPALQRLNAAFLVRVRFNYQSWQVAFASLSVDALWRSDLKEVGALDETASRDVFNNLVDIFAYD